MKNTIDYQAVEKIYNMPLFELLHKAQTIHRENFPENEIELCALLSIKTGACPEDCAYCAQSAHYKTEVSPCSLIDIEEVKRQAKIAKKSNSHFYS